MSTATVQSATTLAIGQAFIRTINVCVAGSAAGTVCDAASTGAAASSNAVAGLPAVAGGLSLVKTIRCVNGITVVPGTGQTIWIDWEN